MITLEKSLDWELWDIAEKEQIDMAEVLCSIPYYKWTGVVSDLCKRFEREELNTLNIKISSLYDKKKGEICNHFFRWKICFEEREIVEINKQEDSQIEYLLCQYAKDIFEYYKRFYKEEIVEQQQYMPVNFQVAVCIKNMQNAIVHEDYKKAIENLKEIKEIYPDFSQAVKLYVQKLEIQIEQQEEERELAKQQMARLVEALKVKIRFFMEQNDIVNALQIVPSRWRDG